MRKTKQQRIAEQRAALSQRVGDLATGAMGCELADPNLQLSLTDQMSGEDLQRFLGAVVAMWPDVEHKGEGERKLWQFTSRHWLHVWGYEWNKMIHELYEGGLRPNPKV